MEKNFLNRKSYEKEVWEFSGSHASHLYKCKSETCSDHLHLPNVKYET